MRYTTASDYFDRFARSATRWTGTGWAFAAALALIIGWTVAGPWFNWSDSHSLFINTVTTVITYLMVFLIQHSQNIDQAELKALLREIAEDLPQVDDARARERAKADEC